MYAPNFLDGYDRLVAFDAETTGKRTPSAEFVRKQPFAWKPPGLVIEVGFVEMLRGGEGWRKGATWGERINPDAPIDPQAIQIHKIKPADLKNSPRFPAIMAKMKVFIGDLPIVAHAYENERDFLDMSSRAPRRSRGATAPIRTSATSAHRCSTPSSFAARANR